MFLLVPSDYETNEEKYANMIQFEWTDESTTSRANMISEMEKFSDRIFVYDMNSLLWRFKCMSFVDEEQAKKYALILVMPVHIVDGNGNLTSFRYWWKLINIEWEVTNR